MSLLERISIWQRRRYNTDDLIGDARRKTDEAVQQLEEQARLSEDTIIHLRSGRVKTLRERLDVPPPGRPKHGDA